MPNNYFDLETLVLFIAWNKLRKKNLKKINSLIFRSMYEISSWAILKILRNNFYVLNKF